jgi:protein farnesyltransferase subunit beta
MKMNEHKSTWAILDRKEHIKKLIDGITKQLPKEFTSLVPQQTWTVYWITHSLALLEQQQLLNTISKDVIQMISDCAHSDGGYGGGPGQIAHLATTFAAVNALITLNTDEALESIDRLKLMMFMHKLKQADGSFAMHEDGEIDSRATYCALAVLRLLNINDQRLLKNVAEWILSCQTYEGGFGATPGNEAHGGYTFCCVASLCLVNQLHRANIPSLLRWLTNKQLEADGGFCGRSNKLVDSCYSYWQGAVFPLLHPYLIQQSKSDQDKLLSNWLFDCAALQEYILNRCQVKGGLLRDKPGAVPDFYHTCYALSGLSISQHQPNGSIFDVGSKLTNIVNITHPLFNLTTQNLNDCFEYFRNKRIEVRLAEDEEP